MVTKTIVHFEIPANEVERLSGFYRTVFGWKFEKAKMPGFDYWLISTGPRGKSVGGGMYKKMGPKDGAKNFIGVEEIDSAIEIGLYRVRHVHLGVPSFFEHIVPEF